MIPEPKMDALLRLTYRDGGWALAHAELDEVAGEIKSFTAKPIPFELAQQVTTTVGLISAEVTRSNHLQWLDEQETYQAAERRRDQARHDQTSERMRELRAKVSGGTT